MKARCLFLLFCFILFASCSSTKNTSGTRWYHSFNTRYNVYFNGNEAFDKALKTQLEGYTENYSEMILMYPVSALPKDKSNQGGAFDKAVEKAVKAIKMHSIQAKPDRKQNKRNDPKYREFMSRREFNPFLHHAWMLMAKSQFYNGDFLEAASSFSYISRLYESQPEVAIPAKLWKARCFAELSWYYDADDILSKINITQLTKNQMDWFSTVNADYLIKQKRYTEAIPHMITAIRSEKNKLQRTREKYLLGQLYTTTGQNDLAYKTFGEVSSSNAPYILELSAKIRQTEVYPGGDINKMSKKLNQMTNSSKNKEYLDQIYYALGNVYMTVPDTAKAIQSYELGVEKSTQGGIVKALNQVKLGDIYFNLRRYLNAQPNYSEALGQLKKSDEAYPRVAKRSEALDALVIHFEAVELQDSLQRLSLMTEEERLAIINTIIENLIKKEKEEQDKARQDEYLARQESLREQQQSNRPTSNTATGGVVPPGETGAFYFYNSQIVTIGKNNFQQRWGRRNLEDDWRRRNKSSPFSDLEQDESVTADTMPEISEDTVENSNNSNADLDQSTDIPVSSNDPKDPQFYLQQIPVTEEDFIASNLIISNGLFNMAVIYKDMLENNPLALETFETLNTRFPENENKEMAYYYSYLIYWQEDKMEMANLLKARIRAEFPESDLAIAMEDLDYEYNLKRMEIIQDSLYQQTYANYINGNIMEIRENYKWISTKYNQSKLMPKFMFLNALSFVQTNEVDTFKTLLKELVEKFPGEDVAALASEIIKGFQRGLLLSASGDNMLARGSLFNIRFRETGNEAVSDSTLQFIAETANPHELLLIYPKKTINDNLLFYTVAGFNFGNFMINDFDLEKTTIGEIGILRIKGFNKQEEAIQYLLKTQQPDGFAQEWGRMVVMVPISAENYATLMKGRSLEEYMAFFEENFTLGNEKLIAQWRLKQAEEMEVLPETEEEKPLPENDGKTSKEIQQPENAVPDDTIQTTLPNSPPVNDSISSEDINDSVNEMYNKASDKIDDISNIINTIASDPARGVLGIFKRKKSNNAIEEFAKQQEKEEKEKLKQLKKDQDEKDKINKSEALQKEKEQKELLKKKEDEEKALKKAEQQQQSDLEKKNALKKKQKEAEKKQKEAEKKRLAKEKKEAQAKALKLKKAEQKAREKARKEEKKRKDKEREELRKQREKERNARLKK